MLLWDTVVNLLGTIKRCISLRGAAHTDIRDGQPIALLFSGSQDWINSSGALSPLFQ